MLSVQRNRRIAMDDGVRLLADLYLPQDCTGPVPALVCFSPYGKEVQALALERAALRTGQSLYDQTVEACDIAAFVAQGYGVVIPSPRGIGNSEGVNHGFLSPQDQKDCCQVIQWTAAQPWCSGAVGMMGTGWAGRIQPLVAARRPSALKAIMPIDLIDDLYQENYPGGACTDYHFAYGGLLPANHQALDAMEELGEAGVQVALARLRRQPEMEASSYLWRALDSWPPSFAQWSVDCLIHDQDGPFWQSRSNKGKAAEIQIPVYCVSFYYEFGRSTAAAFALYNDPDLKTPKKLLLVEAGYNKCNPCHCTTGEMLRWYDHWLKGVQTHILEEAPIKLFVPGREQYRAESQWPTPRTQCRPLYLAPGGALSFAAPQANTQADTLYHQPPTRVAQTMGQIPFLQYETQPLAEPLELCGPLEATLEIAIDQPTAHIGLYLWDVAPDGSRVMLAGGNAKWAALEPQKPQQVKIELPPVVREIQPGHRLRIHLKAMDYPLYIPSEKRTFPLLFPSGRAVGPMPSTLFTHYQVFPGVLSSLSVPVTAPAPGEQWISSEGSDQQ